MPQSDADIRAFMNQMTHKRLEQWEIDAFFDTVYNLLRDRRLDLWAAQFRKPGDTK